MPVFCCQLFRSVRALFFGWVGGAWLAVLPGAPARAQDPQFSQYYAAPLYLNPALLGAQRDWYFGLNHRTQWNSLGFPQYTTQFSATFTPPAPAQRSLPRGGLGATAFSDVAGENGSFATSGASLSGGWNLLAAPQHQFTVGVQAGVVQKRLDATQLRWGSQYDPSIGYNPDRAAALTDDFYQRTFPTVGLGVAWFYQPQAEAARLNAFAGLSVGHLNRPDQSVIANAPSQLPCLWRWHAGARYALSPRLTLAPNLLLVHQRNARQLNVGAYLGYEIPNRRAESIQVSLGTWYRWGDSFIVSAGASSDRYTVGFSYDVNVSSLQPFTRLRGAYEISLACRLRRSDAYRRYSVPLM